MKLHLHIAVFFALMCANAAFASDDKIGVGSEAPTLEPRTSRIAFSADFTGASRIWTVNVDGTQLKNVTSGASNPGGLDGQPAWSPDGQFIVYVSSDGAGADIWIVSATGGSPTRLTSGGASTQPAWSPDGRKIVFVSSKGEQKDLWVMNSDGSQPRKIVDIPGHKNHPRFSPTGDRIVFSTSDEDANAGIWIANADGTAPKQITSGPFRDYEPSWSPRGILFASDRDRSGNWKLWTVQPDGSAMKKIGDVAGHDPEWLPDGRILYTDEVRPSRAVSTISLLEPASGTAQAVVDIQGYAVGIDIRSQARSKRINPKGKGHLEVAILSTASFDAPKSVEQRTITFGRTGSEFSLDQCIKPRDVNGDGILDLVCQFKISAAGFTMQSSQGVLRFLDSNRKPFEGRDAIIPVAKDE